MIYPIVAAIIWAILTILALVFREEVVDVMNMPGGGPVVLFISLLALLASIVWPFSVSVLILYGVAEFIRWVNRSMKEGADSLKE